MHVFWSNRDSVGGVGVRRGDLETKRGVSPGVEGGGVTMEGRDEIEDATEEKISDGGMEVTDSTREGD